MFVSSSTGDDSFPGTEAQPWRTLAKVASYTYTPGRSIHLKAGDVWAETFQPVGSGIFDETTFLSVYASTLSSAQATYQAGSEYSDTVSDVLAAGKDAATAANQATEWCRRLAQRDALAAAFAAADATSSWITLGRYGAGANPKIAPSGTTAVKWPNDWRAGWKVVGVDVGGATTYGYRAEAIFGGQPTGVAKGLWLEDCTTDGITGGTVANPAVPYDNTTKTFVPCGMCISGVDYVYTKNCASKNTGGAPHYVTGCNYMLDVDLLSDTSTVQSDYYQFSTKVVRLRGRVTNLCGPPGYPQGGSGILLSNCTDVHVFDCEIDHNHESPPGSTTSGDGNGGDYEDGITNGTFAGCNIHDNADGPFLLSKSGGHALSGTMLVGNTCANNGLKSIAQTPCFVHNLVDSGGDAALMRANVIHRAASGQKTFAHGGPPGVLNDTPETHWIYCPSNTVSFP